MNNERDGYVFEYCARAEQRSEFSGDWIWLGSDSNNQSRCGSVRHIDSSRHG